MSDYGLEFTTKYGTTHDIADFAPIILLQRFTIPANAGNVTYNGSDPSLAGQLSRIFITPGGLNSGSSNTKFYFSYNVTNCSWSFSQVSTFPQNDWAVYGEF